MKRIILLTHPDRPNTALMERLQWLFPECRIHIVALTESACPAPDAPPPSTVRKRLPRPDPVEDPPSE